MKRTLFIFLSVICCLSAKPKTTVETTTLFNYGKPLVSCETNLENLFANFDKYIEVEGCLDLLTYEYIGEVKNSKHARKLVERNMKHVPKWGIEKGMTTAGNEVRSSIYKLHRSDEPAGRFLTKGKGKVIADNYIQPGDKVYRLSFVYELETFEHYIFVHSDTKEVVMQGNLFGFNVPVKHIEYCNRIAGNNTD